MTNGEAGNLVRALARDLLLARVAHYCLLAIVLSGIVAAAFSSRAEGGAPWLWIGTMTAAFLWALLTILSTRQVRAANQASLFAASGQLDLAETQLREALRSFSIYGAAKLLACHNLAVVAHGRGEFSVAAQLCDGVLARVRRVRGRAHRTTRVLLADARLSLEQVDQARKALAGLDASDTTLSLAERLMLLPVGVRCDVLAGDFASAVTNLASKVGLAELLESPRAALVHLMLSDACMATGKPDAAAWLLRRARLYHDVAELRERYAAPSLPANAGMNDGKSPIVGDGSGLVPNPVH